MKREQSTLMNLAHTWLSFLVSLSGVMELGIFLTLVLDELCRNALCGVCGPC